MLCHIFKDVAPPKNTGCLETAERSGAASARLVRRQSSSSGVSPACPASARFVRRRPGLSGVGPACPALVQLVRRRPGSSGVGPACPALVQLVQRQAIARNAFCQKQFGFRKLQRMDRLQRCVFGFGKLTVAHFQLFHAFDQRRQLVRRVYQR